MKRTLLYFGIICQLFVVLAFALTVNNIDKALAIADSSKEGNLEAVSQSLETAFTFVLPGSILGFIGFCTYFLTVRKIEEKKRWMRRFGVAISVAYLFVFPIGTILGVSALRYFNLNKTKFEEGSML